LEDNGYDWSAVSEQQRTFDDQDHGNDGSAFGSHSSIRRAMDMMMKCDHGSMMKVQSEMDS
jgi:hypothetical protein